MKLLKRTFCIMLPTLIILIMMLSVCASAASDVLPVECWTYAASEKIYVLGLPVNTDSGQKIIMLSGASDYSEWYVSTNKGDIPIEFYKDEEYYELYSCGSSIVSYDCSKASLNKKYSVLYCDENSRLQEQTVKIGKISKLNSELGLIEECSFEKDFAFYPIAAITDGFNNLVGFMCGDGGDYVFTEGNTINGIISWIEDNVVICIGAGVLLGLVIYLAVKNSNYNNKNNNNNNNYNNDNNNNNNYNNNYNNGNNNDRNNGQINNNINVPVPTPEIPKTDPVKPVQPSIQNVNVQPQPTPQVKKYAISCIGGPMNGFIYKIPEKGATLGRDPSSTVCYPKDELTVSRMHALVYVKNGEPYLVSYSKSNGTFIKGKGAIQPDTPVHISTNDLILLGSKNNAIQVVRR